MKKNGILKKVRRSFLGRVLCRMFGEEKGAVMMEYVILGLLIAAAVVVAAGYLGNVLNTQFATLVNVTATNPENARKNLDASRVTAAAGEEAIQKHSDKVQEGGALNVTTGGANGNW